MPLGPLGRRLAGPLRASCLWPLLCFIGLALEFVLASPGLSVRRLLVLLVEVEVADDLSRGIAATSVELKLLLELWEDVFDFFLSQGLAAEDLRRPNLEYVLVVDTVLADNLPILVGVDAHVGFRLLAQATILDHLELVPDVLVVWLILGSEKREDLAEVTATNREVVVLHDRRSVVLVGCQQDLLGKPV